MQSCFVRFDYPVGEVLGFLFGREKFVNDLPKPFELHKPQEYFIFEQLFMALLNYRRGVFDLLLGNFILNLLNLEYVGYVVTEHISLAVMQN